MSSDGEKTISAAELRAVVRDLDRWISERQWRGHGPFDALLSPWAGVVRPFRWPSVALTQLRRRSRVDLAPWLRIPTHENPKALALGVEADLLRGDLERADEHLDRLLALRHSSGGWGYPFPWANRHFRAPAGTPSGVVTGFVARALRARIGVDGGRGWEGDAIEEAARFVERDLPRLDAPGGIVFAYTPGDDRAVFNASLLAAEVLATAGGRRDAVAAAVGAVLSAERDDGLVPYGTSRRDAFVDSYHTGYVLSSLRRIGTSGALGSALKLDVDAMIDRGLAAWIRVFSGGEGVAYRPGRAFPVELHGVAQGILTFLEFSDRIDDGVDRARRLATWAVRKARGSDGAFDYLWTPERPNRVRYLRWVQCWMLLALAALERVEESG